MNKPDNRRKKESRRRIETAFIRLLLERELDKITVTEICHQAEVNRTTFYANYLDIRDLVDAVRRRLEQEVMELYQEERSGRYSSHDFLRLFSHIRDNQLFYKAYFQLGLDGSFQTFGYDEALAARLFDNRFLDYHMAFFHSGLNAIIKLWLDNGCRETPEEIAEILRTEYGFRRGER